MVPGAESLASLVKNSHKYFQFVNKQKQIHTIVHCAILHNQLQVFPELLAGWVKALADVLAQRLQVHWFRNDLVIVFDNFPINRLVEGIRLWRRRTRAGAGEGLERSTPSTVQKVPDLLPRDSIPF